MTENITSQTYIDKLGVIPSNCSCNKCKQMCMAPCCGSVEDFEKIIEAGYADRLMYDDLPSTPDGGNILKPALKEYEGGRAPWHVRSMEGCTFFKYGKCELHKSGLKPIQGKLANHEGTKASSNEYAEISKQDWESERGKALIEKWKKLVNYEK